MKTQLEKIDKMELGQTIEFALFGPARIYKKEIRKSRECHVDVHVNFEHPAAPPLGVLKYSNGTCSIDLLDHNSHLLFTGFSVNIDAVGVNKFGTIWSVNRLD